MPRKKITFCLHGLAVEKNTVDAAVFARKLSAIVRGLSRADKIGNQGRRLDFVITELRMGSGFVGIEERQARANLPPTASGIEKFHAAIASIASGNGAYLSSELIPPIKSLGKGANKMFSHIDVVLDDDNETAVRVDNFFLEQVGVATNALAALADKRQRRLFKGRTKTTLDGTLKAVDHRGPKKLAFLRLTAGGAEIECTYSEQIAALIRPAFDVRSRVEAWAHYDGIAALPRRLELISAKPLKQNPDLKRWKGAFNIEPSDSDEWAE